MKYACIERYRDEFPVQLMCRVLGVSRAGFYAAQRRPASARQQANQRLRLRIRTEHAISHGCYGAPMIYAELRDQGVACGRHRVARLMREDKIRGCCRRAFRVTTQSNHREPVAANTLERRFAPATWRERDRAWVADITYLRTLQGWLYLAVVLDLASRRVVGWCVDAGLGQSLALCALQRALTLRRPAPGLLHHSDRGVQYASAAYQALLHAHGATSSMSRVGNCWDNAVAESFFATLKAELADTRRWPSHAAAQRDLAAYIDGWYNQQRRHSSLGYRSPMQYERDLAQLRAD